MTFYFVSGNNDMRGGAENSQGQNQGKGEKDNQAEPENILLKIMLFFVFQTAGSVHLNFL